MDPTPKEAQKALTVSELTRNTINQESLEEITREFQYRQSRTLHKLPAGDHVYTLASRLEDLAYSTLLAFTKQTTLPPSVQRTIQSAGLITQPLDEDHVRLVIYTPTRVIHAGVWPTRFLSAGVWPTAGQRAIIDAVWNALEQCVQHSHATS